MVLDKREAGRLERAAKSGCTLQEYARKTSHTRLVVLEGKQRQPEIPLEFIVDRKWRGEIAVQEREMAAQRKWSARKMERKKSRRRFLEGLAGTFSTLGAAACSLIIMMAAESDAVKWVAFIDAAMATVGAFGFAKKMDEEARKECWK